MFGTALDKLDAMENVELRPGETHALYMELPSTCKESSIDETADARSHGRRRNSHVQKIR